MRRAFLLPVVLTAACGVTDGPAKPTTTTAATATAAPTPPPPPAPTPAPKPPPPQFPDRPIFHPERATERAPDRFKVRFSTTKGDFVVEATRAWAPHGADRFYNLIKLGFYDGVYFHRAVEGFMVQFGIHGDPLVNRAWHGARIPDDKPVKSNTRGFVTFAMAGPNSRTTQLFINFVDQNKRLDSMGFAPFGQVIEGMRVVDTLYQGYGELKPRGKGPDPGLADREGDAYLAKEYPKLDKIKSARLL